MKENQIRELVNELRDIAIEYHGTQQLRERIARTVRAAMLQAGNSPVIPCGWKLVPEKADEDMIAEGNIMVSSMIETVGKIDVSLIYGAMLAAAPEKETGPCTK